MVVLAVDRNVGLPRPQDVVDTQDWLRPAHLGRPSRPCP